jgi:molybdate transport system substrate-binding protein
MRRSPVAAVGAAVAVAAVAGGVLAGCDSSATSATQSPPSASAGGSAQLSGTVNVFAAASLKEAFTTLGRQFETAHPGVKLVLNFGPSSGLAAQITQGAPADVFASASTKNMAQVVTAGEAALPRNFARNSMEIAVPAHNPAKIRTLMDVAEPGVKLALCQPAVPCGTTARQVFVNARIPLTPVTQEADVKAVLTKVTLGEVDAGIVYVTDVRASGAKVKGIKIPAELNAFTLYPIATLTKAPNKPAAAAFTDFVLSERGAGVLTATGFGRP